MNPITIEKSVLHALRQSAFPTEPIYLGSDFTELPNQEMAILVECSDVEHPTGSAVTVNSAHKAVLRVTVAAPGLMGPAMHDLMESTLTKVWGALTPWYLNTYWPGNVTAAKFAGIHAHRTTVHTTRHERAATVEAWLGVVDSDDYGQPAI